MREGRADPRGARARGANRAAPESDLRAWHPSLSWANEEGVVGQQGQATCRDCEHSFRLSTSGGFVAQIVFCEDCGRGGSVFHNQQVLGEGDPVAVVGTCSHCRGHLRLGASPRCPRCRSAELEIGPMDLLWD